MTLTLRFLIFMCLFFRLEPLFAKSSLTVYTYQSFVSEWGPGSELKKLFEQKCDCTLKFISSGDGATLISKLKLEGRSSQADVILGVDNSVLLDAIDSDLFLPLVPSKAKLQVSIPDKIRLNAVPFDFGMISVMYDSLKIANPPKSLDDLLERADFKKKLILQDPRFSAPGLSFLDFLSSTYGSRLPEKLKLLRNQTLTVTPGWSEAYSLFTKREAPLVISYTTSEFYHHIVEKSSRYRAALFSEHSINVEFAGVVKTTKNKPLATSFVDFLLFPEAQKIIAQANWMYPMIPESEIKDLNPIFTNASKPKIKELNFLTASDRKKLNNVWLSEFK
ncbi:MAG: thiamine ABC transporter substrate-binding protein [Pseudomonadota bacterium]